MEDELEMVCNAGLVQMLDDDDDEEISTCNPSKCLFCDKHFSQGPQVCFQYCFCSVLLTCLK